MYKELGDKRKALEGTNIGAKKRAKINSDKEDFISICAADHDDKRENFCFVGCNTDDCPHERGHTAFLTTSTMALFVSVLPVGRPCKVFCYILFNYVLNVHGNCIFFVINVDEIFIYLVRKGVASEAQLSPL